MPRSSWKLASTATDWNGSYRNKKEKNFDLVKKMVLENHYYSLRELLLELSTFQKTVRHIFVYVLCMRHVAARPCTNFKNPFFQKSILVADFLTKCVTNVMKNAKCSLFKTSSDFFLFPKIKLSFRGTRLESIADIKEKSLRE